MVNIQCHLRNTIFFSIIIQKPEFTRNHRITQNKFVQVYFVFTMLFDSATVPGSVDLLEGRKALQSDLD